MKGKNIGIDVKAPAQKCDDENCPFHGNLRARGRIFKGTVVSDKMHKTVVVEWTVRHYLRKYERYEKRRTKLKVHNPPCMNAKEGDIVRIIECRPLSKTKTFVVIENLGKERGFAERSEALQEAKFQHKEVKEEAKVEV
ncbi:30S ribosomal protein S17 [Candidatus Woesearchaeota archaeon]|nr:30S ribosomal protein S17 [Candidatus Woesearchaeota archaeon]